MVLLEGHLTADPQVKTTEKGTPLCTFCVAHNRYYKKDEETEKETYFIDVEAWDKTAELCRDLALKGTAVRVTGRLKQNRWDDAEGNPRSRILITADRVEFRGRSQQETEPAGGDEKSPQEA
jgi:single-strand DNA-binding protein